MLKYLHMHSILIVEDKVSMAKMLKETLENEGYRIIIARNAKEGIRMIREESPDMLLTDIKLPDRDGIEVLKASKEESPLRPVIVMTAYGSVEVAVSAMKEGAFDFITKPFDTDHLRMLIGRALENQQLIKENILLKEEFSSTLRLPVIIGKSRSIVDVAENIKKAAPEKTTLLLLGESGTGKELFARAVHHLSGRGTYPFVPINCAAMPRELLESELFGYEKGAFTGAESRKLGKFELANRGSIFLDEIAELDPALQAKLLRVLQESEIERVGGTKPIKIDVRVIAATNKNLSQAIEKGSFREDLYYRLSVFPLVIPPLRERREDISLLAEHFINKFTREMKKEQKDISKEAMLMLKEYDWKGNVRELENAIERAIILCDGKTIGSEHIFLRNLQQDNHGLKHILMDAPLEEVSRSALRIAETERIKRALDDAGGNKSRAAEGLKVSYKTLLTKIKEYGIR
jgi:DNA-binding NtrC family response regulator